MARIGYARVSTEDQNLSLQYDALRKADCNKIYDDVGISAATKSRPGLIQAINVLKPGDVFIIWKMDRAFRSLKHALSTLELLEERNVEFCSLTEHFDTTTPMGKCMYQVSNAFAELERNLISERTKAGLEAARLRGAKLGRPRKLSEEQIAEARRLVDADLYSSLTEVANAFRVHEKTLQRALEN